MYTADCIYNKKNKKNKCSQDYKQRLFVGVELLVEIYRVIIGTCLITFVPQICGNEKCGYIWYLSGKTFIDVTYYTNIGTLFIFLALFVIELIRENRIINYLEVTPLLGTDNEGVGQIIQLLNPIKRKKLYCIDTVYVAWSSFSLCCFVVNTTMSGIIILRNLDNKTTTTFITNILFMFTKLYRIYYVINTEKNIFYSAYIMNFMQFNDLDPREIEYIKSQKIEEDIFEETWISIKEDML
jgi:hypothetical protein